MNEDKDDYVTVNPAVGYQKFNAVVMRYSADNGSHMVYRISEAMSKPAAEALAKSWAAALRCGIR